MSIKSISIYVHIPFCDSKCYYCNFVSFKQSSQIKEKYFDALYNEIRSFESAEKYVVKTIYFGGGTPSCVKPEFIKSTLETIKDKFVIDSQAEITIECNPNSVDENKLFLYKEIGINRLSFGVQSFNKKALKFVGRIQNNTRILNKYKKNTVEVLKSARKLGFNNVSVDFILGLPYQTNRDIRNVLKKVSKFTTHFSCYMLMIEKETKLSQILPKGIDEGRLINQYELAVKVLKKLGFKRYEVSNFAKYGFESKHNQVYWNMEEYLGFGLASHSFYDNNRIANTENLDNYILTCHKSIEKLTKEQLAEESIMLALRTYKGLDLVKFKNNFYDLEKTKTEKLALLVNSGFIKYENNFLKLTDKGLMVSNKIISELI